MKKAQAPRPSTRELHKLYLGLRTTSVLHRIDTLKVVLQWYDQALEYLRARNRKQEPMLDQLKCEERMLKSRRLGMSSTTQVDKANYFCDAIIAAEELCRRLHPFPVRRAFKESEQYMGKLLEKQSRLELKYAKVLRVLADSLRPESSRGGKLKLCITQAGKARVSSHSADEYVYSRKEAKQCRTLLWQAGLLPLAVQELKLLSRVAANEDDGDGHFKVNYEKQIVVVFRMLESLIEYCKGPDAPRRLVKTVEEAMQ